MNPALKDIKEEKKKIKKEEGAIWGWSVREAREARDALLVVTVLFLRKRATTGKQSKAHLS